MTLLSLMHPCVAPSSEPHDESKTPSTASDCAKGQMRVLDQSNLFRKRQFQRAATERMANLRVVESRDAEIVRRV